MYRTALFVDFDNIYTNFRNSSYQAAEAFVRSSSQWIDWFRYWEDGRSDKQVRRILVRNVYLNPVQHGQARGDLLRAGFRVIECPSLTRHTKSSADAHLLLDVVDALAHPVGYDEIAIFSADADFTPVLWRARALDRRTVVFALGSASLAYTCSADVVIPEETFLRDALRMPIENKIPSVVNQDQLLEEMAAQLVTVIRTSGDMQVRDLPPFFRRFPSFTRESNWLGYRSVRKLVEAIVTKNKMLQIAGAEGADWHVTVVAEPVMGLPVMVS